VIKEIARLPDISFIGDITLDEIKERLITDYQTKFQEETNQAVVLKDGEPITLMLYACAVQFMQMYENVNKAGKMNFLKYAYGDYLDNLVAIKGVERQDAAAAVCTVRFSLSAIRSSVISIPQGTRVTTQNADIYFATDEYAEIPIGESYVDVHCSALTDGIAGNDIPAGALSIMVDPVAYVATCENLEATSGGTDRESDESLADRAYLVPANYSVAGPETAYEYWVKTAYPELGDAKITSPSACVVDIRVIGKNGELLSEDVCQTIEDYIINEGVIPLTDQVSVSSPEIVTYNVDLTYYINRSDALSAADIQAAVEQAVTEYTNWQSGRIGRDIEPGKLIELCMAAGAKRVVVNSPAFAAVAGTAIPQLGTKTITYGGLQDD